MRDDRQSWRKSDLYQVVSEEGVAPSGEVDLENRHAFKALGASLVAQGLKCLPAMLETRFKPWVGKMPWRRKWQPTPVLFPGESHGWRSLVDYNPQSLKE